MRVILACAAILFAITLPGAAQYFNDPLTGQPSEA
jgi:hypothetical protein